MEYKLHEQDVNMGNEDTWTLIVPAEKAELYVKHWWSHRDGKYDFKTGTKMLTLEDLKRSKQWLYEKAVEYLKAIGYGIPQ